MLYLYKKGNAEMNVMIVEDNPMMREMIKRFVIKQVDNVEMIVESSDGRKPSINTGTIDPIGS